MEQYLKCPNYVILGHCGGQVVSLLTFKPDDLSSNPAFC